MSHASAWPIERAFRGEGDVIHVAKEWHDQILVQIHCDCFASAIVFPGLRHGELRAEPDAPARADGDTAGRGVARSRAEQSSDSSGPTGVEGCAAGSVASLNSARSTVSVAASECWQPAPIRRIYEQRLCLLRLGCLAGFAVSRKTSAQRRDRETRCRSFTTAASNPFAVRCSRK